MPLSDSSVILSNANDDTFISFFSAVEFWLVDDTQEMLLVHKHPFVYEVLGSEKAMASLHHGIDKLLIFASVIN